MTIEEALQRFKGGKMADCVAVFEQLLGYSLPADFEPNFRARCARCMTDRLEPIAGAHEVLQRLPLPYCLASSGPREKDRIEPPSSPGWQNILATGSSALTTSANGNRIRACFCMPPKAMGVAPEHCAVVEDSLPGVHAGIAAGMRVFVLAGEPIPDHLSDSVQVLPRLEDLLPRLSRSGCVSPAAAS